MGCSNQRHHKRRAEAGQTGFFTSLGLRSYKGVTGAENDFLKEEKVPL